MTQQKSRRTSRRNSKQGRETANKASQFETTMKKRVGGAAGWESSANSLSEIDKDCRQVMEVMNRNRI
uniref:Small, acid-soluble spore protein, alpha/beta type n=1 Tax=Panagrellus redivivus TaxID=6233 RepID=A0A7E4WCN2_PANRE